MIKSQSAFLIVLISIAVFFSCQNTPSLDTAYENQITELRSYKDEKFKNSNTSPISGDKIQNFKGLNYFNIDHSWKIQAEFKKQKLPKYQNLYEGKDVKHIHQVAGILSFILNDHLYNLQAYSSIGQPTHLLFVPYLDDTNGKKTYAGGKYVEAVKSKDGKYTIDFNTSYHPYCLYNNEFQCAVCPSQNYIPLAINAGEKLPPE